MDLVARLKKEFQTLIDSGVRRFLFGSESIFNNLCLDVFENFHYTYPKIKVEYYKTNKTAINNSDYCIFYYDLNNYIPEKNTKLKGHAKSKASRPNSMAVAYRHALNKNKNIINVFD